MSLSISLIHSRLSWIGPHKSIEAVVMLLISCIASRLERQFKYEWYSNRSLLKNLRSSFAISYLVMVLLELHLKIQCTVD